MRSLHRPPARVAVLLLAVPLVVAVACGGSQAPAATIEQYVADLQRVLRDHDDKIDPAGSEIAAANERNDVAVVLELLPQLMPGLVEAERELIEQVRQIVPASQYVSDHETLLTGMEARAAAMQAVLNAVTSGQLPELLSTGAQLDRALPDLAARLSPEFREIANVYLDQ